MRSRDADGGDRLSIAMEQRAYAIGYELQMLGPGARVAASRPRPVQTGPGQWEYQWDMLTSRNPLEPMPVDAKRGPWDLFQFQGQCG